MTKPNPPAMAIATAVSRARAALDLAQRMTELHLHRKAKFALSEAAMWMERANKLFYRAVAERRERDL